MAIWHKWLPSTPRVDKHTSESPKIRVLLVITGLAAGGATNVVLDIAHYLNQHPDFNVHLLTGPPPPGRTDVTHLAYQQGIQTFIEPSLVNYISPLANLRALVAIRQFMVNGHFDVVHTHSSVAGIIGRLAAAAAKIPVIMHHVHGWPSYEDMSGGMRIMYLTLERFCARFTNRIITVAKPDIQKGLTYQICAEDKFTLIPNGIDLDKFRQATDDGRLRHELGLAPNCKIVAMVGRLDVQKNPLDFIRAAAIVSRRYADVQFLMVGDGCLRIECEHLIDELDLKNKVFLAGYRSDISNILSIVTLLAMSSLWEGLPIAFLEAMSAGKPIVANDVGGVSDVVIEGETGFLVPPRQPAKMAERILYLLEQESLCNEIGRVARQRSNDYSVQRMLGQLTSLYKELWTGTQYTGAVYQGRVPN